MYHNISAIFAVIILLSLTSCKKDFFNSTIDVPPTSHDNRLAVSAFISDTDTSYIVADVTQTYDLDDYIPNSNNLTINGAEVLLYRGEELLYTYERTGVHPGGGYSIPISGAFGGTGETFKLVVKHPNFNNTEATQTMPRAVALSDINFRNISSESDDRNGELKFTFDDPAGEENYYEISVSQQAPYAYTDEDGSIIEGFFESHVTLSDEDDLFSDPIFAPSFLSRATLVADKSFDGKQKTLVIPFEKTANSDEFTLYWRSVTKEYYLYARSLALNSTAASNPFSEPVTVFTNIENGVGCFCLRTELVYEVE